MKNSLKYDKNTAAMLLLISFIIQVIIITYNQITGYISIDNTIEMFVRLSFASIVSFGISSLLFVLNNKLIMLFSKWTDWESNFIKRLLLEMGAAAIMGAALMGFITYFLNFFGIYEGSILRHIINNMMILAVINIIFVSVMEGILFYRRWRLEMIKTEQLEKENAIARYEALKNQVNPHFLFNNLNVLSSLIYKDASIAEKFVQEFSKIYRYVLDTSEKIVVELSDELGFIDSYLFLIKIRYSEGILYDIRIDPESMNKYLIPLGLQILVENCVKHNIISKRSPISINIYDDLDFIIVENNINKKQVFDKKEQLGLKNLQSRYSFLSERKPVFKIENDKFIAKLPLIEAE
jgi:two-component system LytT family sensor kinase